MFYPVFDFVGEGEERGDYGRFSVGGFVGGGGERGVDVDHVGGGVGGVQVELGGQVVVGGVDDDVIGQGGDFYGDKINKNILVAMVIIFISFHGNYI